MTLDRGELHKLLCGSPNRGEYPDTLWDRVNRLRRDALAECKARGLTVPLTGSTDPAALGHAAVDSLLSESTAQTRERWGDDTRSDGRQWALPEAITQLGLCSAALDAADKAAANPAPSSASAGWSPVPLLTGALVTDDTSSFQSALPSWSADGMHVVLPARGDLPGTPNPTTDGQTQRCEVSLAGPWQNLNGMRYLRYDFTIAGGPVDTTDWWSIAQLKNSGRGSPPLELMVGSGRVYVQWHDAGGNETGREWLGPVELGVRHSVVLVVPFSVSNPTVTGWMDGEKKFAAAHGPTLYPGQTSYGKLGCYRSNRIGVPCHVIHHGVRFGSLFAEVIT